jgi:hypothetical protein
MLLGARAIADEGATWGVRVGAGNYGDMHGHVRSGNACYCQTHDV